MGNPGPNIPEDRPVLSLFTKEALMLEYVVHSCVEVPVETKAMLGDREVSATVPGLVVELVSPEDDLHGHGAGHGHTFRLTPDSNSELEEKKKLFKVGNRIRLDFSPIEGASLR